MSNPALPSTSAFAVSASSIAYAAELAGPAFGNDGTDPAQMSMGIGPAFAGLGVWPFTYLVYMLVRTDHVREGSWCSTRSMLSASYEFTTTNALGGQLLAARNFVQLPSSIAAPSLAAFQSAFMCNGTLVTQPSGDVDTITVYASPTLWNGVASFAVLDQLSANVEFAQPLTVTQQQSYIGAVDLSGGWILAADENMSTQLLAQTESGGVVQFPLGIVGLAFLYNFCIPNDNACPYLNTQLQLDITTAGLILSGAITWWNDSRILSQQQPGALEPDYPIAMFSAPFELSNEWVRTKIQACCIAEFEFTGTTVGVKSLANAVTIVTAIPGAFMFAPVNQTLLELSAVRRRRRRRTAGAR